MKHLLALMSATLVGTAFHLRFVDGDAGWIALPAVFCLFHISLYLYYAVGDFRVARKRILNRKRMWV